MISKVIQQLKFINNVNFLLRPLECEAQVVSNYHGFGLKAQHLIYSLNGKQTLPAKEQWWLFTPATNKHLCCHASADSRYVS